MRKLTAAGKVTTVAGTYKQLRSSLVAPPDGARDVARFGNVVGLTVGSDHQIYVADIVDPFSYGSVRRVTTQGVVTTIVLASNLSDVRGVTADGNGNVYFASEFGPNGGFVGITDTAGNSPRTLANVSFARNLTVDNSGNLLVTSVPLDHGPLGQSMFSCVLYRLTPAGAASLLVGKVATTNGENTCGSGDGPGDVARFSIAYGVGSSVAVGADGFIYMADGGNNIIRKISPAGVVVTIAGLTGVTGSADGTGPEARFNKPTSVALDRNGNVFVTDSGNSTIRRVTPDGVVTTVAGKAGEVGNIDTP